MPRFCYLFVTVWRNRPNGNTFASRGGQMKFRKIFKDIANMNTEKQNENPQQADETGNPAAAADQQVMTEELTAEQKLTAELASERDKFLRLFAEFENYKRRTAKERLDLFKTANQEVLVAMLPILDDFDRAMAEIGKSGDESLLKGVALIHEKFKNTLTGKGLETVSINPGDAFDADFAEAITQIPAPSEDMKGKIIDVVEKGYKLGDKIIRFPKVVTGQ
jgi:molecular chaperone GrpE